MRSGFRLHVLLLSLLLSLAGLGQEAHALLLPTSTTATEDSLSGEVTVKRLADSFGLQQQSEQVISPVQSFPAPLSKLQSPGFAGSSAGLEQRLFSFATAYLARATDISPGLDIPALIFPFHYFW